MHDIFDEQRQRELRRYRQGVRIVRGIFVTLTGFSIISSIASVALDRYNWLALFFTLLSLGCSLLSYKRPSIAFAIAAASYVAGTVIGIYSISRMMGLGVKPSPIYYITGIGPQVVLAAIMTIGAIYAMRYTKLQRSIAKDNEVEKSEIF